MAIGSGMGSSFGFSAETVYGTRVAPAKFTRAKSYSLNRTQERPQGEGIQGGAYGELLDHYVETVNGGEATVAFDVQTKAAGLGVFLNTLMGGTVTATQISTSGAYTQAHTMADPLGKSLTMQVSAPYRSGTAATHEITGAKVESAEFSCGVKEILSCNAKFDAKAFSTTQSLAAPSYATNAVFNGSQATLKLGAFSSEAAVSGVRNVTCHIERAMDTDDYTYAASGNKSEPVLNGVTKISGAVTVDWTTANKTAFQDRVENNTSCSLIWEFVSTTAIGGSAYPTFRIAVPSVIWTGDMQGVDGRDVLQSTFNYEWKYDGTNLPVVTYISADTTL